MLMPTELELKSVLSGKNILDNEEMAVLIHRLLFDGQRITEDQTAQDLDLEDGDSLEVLLERKPNRLIETYSLDAGILVHLLTHCRGWWVLGGIMGMLGNAS